MKKINKGSIIFLLLSLISISFFGFGDNIVFKYKDYNKSLILRDDGAFYQKGKIVIMLKEALSNISSTSFNIEGIDRIISQNGVTKIVQRFPLKSDISKRMKGDDLLAKIYTINYSGKTDPTDLSSKLLEMNKDIIEWAEPDFVYMSDYTPNDPLISSQYHIAITNCYQAWDITKGDTNVVIGIVDSGSDLDHPDLSANIKYNYADPINNIDDDNNGFIDDFLGWDFFYGDNDPNIAGGSDHGSHVSGCADQVVDNNVHGGGPGFKVKIRITKHAPDYASTSIYNGYDGVTYQYQNGAKIVNCSWGSGSFSSLGQTVVTNAWNNGCMVFGSAGNDGANVPRYPGSLDNVVSVAATNNVDVKASFSNYHSTVDISGPGDAIISTLYNNTYATYSGTSMSTPVTAGIASLIKSKYPSWTNQQVLDRLLLGVDSIYGLNPSYVGMLGTGRVNAFKCVADKPIIKILSYTHNDSVYGNNDKVYETGEKIPLLFTYKNSLLAGTNISLRISTTDTNVQIVKDSIFVGNLAAFSTNSTTLANTFEVMAKPNCPYDRTVTFKMIYSNSCYTDNAGNTFTVTFRQGWATHNINNLKLSLTRDGAVGKKTQAYGNGLFITGYSTSSSQIYEGGLMIGANNTKVSDVCRKGTAPATSSDTDFVGLQSYTMKTPGGISNQDGLGLFNDDGAAANKIGVEVRQTSYAYNTSGDENYIILRYRIKNTSGANLSNIFAGIFMFFSPEGLTSDNMTALDTLNKFGYTYNTITPNPYLGLALLSNQTLNFSPLVGSTVLNGFTTQEKWDALSSGIVNGQVGPGLNCMVVSAGPLSINNNDSVIVGFAVAKGNDLNDLKNNVIKARLKYGPIGIEQISNEIPSKFELYQNYPNPFNPTTSIKFEVPKADFVKVNVFDAIGRLVATLVDKKLDAGIYRADFDGMNYSSGVYFYRIETSSYFDVKKMILIK